MGIIEIILTSLALSMDAFAGSICKGLTMKKFEVKKELSLDYILVYFKEECL